ncbi:MAG: hypothetical protein RLZZ361_1165 [Cyanobacteriota bacterium]|jgi:hypothetical protein
MSSSSLNFQIFFCLRSLLINGTPNPNYLGFQYIINSSNPLIEILHCPLPDKLSPKPQDPNDAIQSAPEIDKLLEALNKIDWNKDQIDLEILLKKLNSLKQDRFEYYRCAEIISPHLASLISKNKEFNLSIMNLTLAHLEEFDFPNDQLKIIIDSLVKKLTESHITDLSLITKCFKKLKDIDPSLTKILIKELFKLIKESSENPNTTNCLEILQGLEYNNSPKVKPLLEYVLRKLTKTKILTKREIGLVLKFLREKDPELYAKFINQKSKIIFSPSSDNSFDNIVNFLSLPSVTTNNNVIEAYINKLENFNSADDFSIHNCCRLIKYCRNKNQNHANRILLALDKKLENRQEIITKEDKQIILRELNLLKFVNTDTANLEVLQSLKNKFNVQRLQESPRNQIETRIQHLLKYLELRILPNRYFDGIEMDFLIMIGSGPNTRKINLEIDGRSHNKFHKIKEEKLRDDYLAKQNIEVIRLKLPNGCLEDTALKKLICEKLGIN